MRKYKTLLGKKLAVVPLVTNHYPKPMSPVDTGYAVLALQELTGWSFMDIERRGIMKNDYASRVVALTQEDKDIQSLITKKSGGSSSGREPLSEAHVRYTRQSGVKPEEHKPISKRHVGRNGKRIPMEKAKIGSIKVLPSASSFHRWQDP